MVDFAINVGTILLSTTLYASQPLLLGALLLVPAAAAFFLPPETAARRKPKVPKAKSSPKTKSDGAPKGILSLKPFVTSYRGSMMAMTCTAILAVDFPLFPRRFAKVETWGTSLMDLGVGSFVFSAGLVAARPVLVQRAEGTVTPLARRLLLSIRHSLPLLALGVARTLSVKGLDYAEHVSEYGVHWNFFFTLGLLPPFVAVFRSALGAAGSFGALALLLAAGYEAALDFTGLGAYVLAAPRAGLLSMNKEGVFSFFGYLAIFLAGQDAGMYVLPRSINAGASRAAQRKTLLVTMAARAAGWAALYFLSTSYGYGLGLQVSRRLANLPYVLWVAAFNSAQLLVYYGIEAVFFPDAAGAADEGAAHKAATSRILRSFNRNGLAVFLLANLLTGLVNMTVPTLDVGPVVALGILVGYSVLLCGVAVGLDVWDVTIKL
ncbi:hypothetical protein IMZ48_20390 [Candidatus Bathyarchaeota archaeon]|nr:hypothetical protein [Candidatus Bathyarchaeota archaeon]